MTRRDTSCRALSGRWSVLYCCQLSYYEFLNIWCDLLNSQLLEPCSYMMLQFSFKKESMQTSQLHRHLENLNSKGSKTRGQINLKCILILWLVKAWIMIFEYFKLTMLAWSFWKDVLSLMCNVDQTSGLCGSCPLNLILIVIELWLHR